LRSVRVLWNVVTNYARLGLSAAIAFVLTPYMVHRMGDRDYGLWVTVFSLTGYFGLFDQGIRPSLVRYVSRDHALGDREGLARTISSAIVLYMALGVATMLAAWVVAINAPLWIRMDPALHRIAPTLVLLVGATLALGFPLGVFGAVLSGLQRYDLANGIGMAVGILRLVVFVGVLRAHGGLVALAWSSLGVNLFGHVWSWWAARRLLPGVPIGPGWVERAYFRRIAAYGSWALVGALATNIAFQTDALVITAFIGTAFAAPFAIAGGLVDNARSLVTAAAYVLSPTASEMDALGEGAKLRRILVAGSKYSVLVSWPVLLGLIIFGANLLHTWVGPHYESASLLLTILAVPTMVALPQATASSLLFGISRHRGVVLLSILSAVLNLALSVWWASHPAAMAALFGNTLRPALVGVAMGTAVPLLVVSGFASAWYACRVLEEPFLHYLWEGMLRPGLVCVVFVVPAMAVQLRWHPTGWWPLLGACAGSWLAFAVVAWFAGISSDDRGRWSRMITGLVARRAAPEGNAG
jgi:O-antigen/teichoic acid export membrane protein